MNKRYKQRVESYLVKTSAMNGEEADEASGIAAHIIESQQTHVLILIILVLGSLRGWIGQVCTRTTVNVRVEDGGVT